MEDLSYIDPSSPTIRQSLADILRGMTKKEDYQQMGQAIQNTGKLIPSITESLARGAIAQVPGTFGDISQLAREYAPNTMQSTFGNRVAPTTEEILQAIPRINPDYQGSSQHEMVGSLTAPALAKMLKMGAEATKGMKGGLSIAYHGTPHEIQGGFDLSKVGTGEGNQTYGHGIYFAENPSVAKGYQETLGQKKDIVVFKGNDGFYVKKGLGSEGENLAGPFSSGSEAEKVRKALPENQGNLYKVDVPDEHMPFMLHWDKPLTEQTPEVRKALEKIGIKTDKQKLNEFDDALLAALTGNANTTLPKEPLNALGSSIYHNVLTGSPESKSAKLNELGIKGIRYLDEGSRGKKEGTYNIVTFDPQTVKILEKNGKPVNEAEQNFEGFMPHYKEHENLASVFEKHGLDVKETGSAHSSSRYVEITDPISGETFTTRFSNHPQSGQAMSLHGPADLEIGKIFKNKSWKDAVNPILDRINKARKEYGDEILNLRTVPNRKETIKKQLDELK